MGLFGVFGEAVDCTCDTHCTGVNEGVCEVGQSIEDAADHPQVHFVTDFVLEVGIDHFRRTVHWSCDCLDLLLDASILSFADALEIDEPVGARSKITEFKGLVLANQDVLYLDILVIDPNFVDLSETLQHGINNSEQFLLAEALVLTGSQQVEKGAIGTVLHQDHKDLELAVPVL